MRALPLRAWILIAIVAIVIGPLVSGVVAVAVEYREVLHPSQQKIAEALKVEQLAESARSWEDPSWQAEMGSQAALARLDVLIVGAGGGLVYGSRHNVPGPTPADPSRRVSNAGGETALLYIREEAARTPNPVAVVKDQSLALGAGLAWLVLVLVALFQLTRRSVLSPLASLGVAARDLQDQRLPVHMPNSAVAEVQSVAHAFSAMTKALRESVERQSEMEQQRRFLIAAITHDLRTPLFALRGYLEGLQRGIVTSPEDTSRYVSICSDRAAVLEARIGELFAFARIDLLDSPSRAEPVELSELIRTASEDLAATAHARRVSLTLSGSAGGCTVMADRDLLRRAIENLIENAFRYSSPGDEVVVSWGRERSAVVFTVVDRGPGINPVDLPHIFEPLYRADTSRNRDTGGTGLGLAIARSAFVVHGGSLEASNRPEGGAQFTGFLPLGRSIAASS